MAVSKGTKTIGINIKEEIANELERRAKSMQLSSSKYIKIILSQHLESGKKLKLAEK